MNHSAPMHRNTLLSWPPIAALSIVAMTLCASALRASPADSAERTWSVGIEFSGTYITMSGDAASMFPGFWRPVDYNGRPADSVPPVFPFTKANGLAYGVRVSRRIASLFDVAMSFRYSKYSGTATAVSEPRPWVDTVSGNVYYDNIDRDVTISLERFTTDASVRVSLAEAIDLPVFVEAGGSVSTLTYRNVTADEHTLGFMHFADTNATSLRQSIDNPGTTTHLLFAVMAGVGVEIKYDMFFLDVLVRTHIATSTLFKEYDVKEDYTIEPTIVCGVRL